MKTTALFIGVLLFCSTKVCSQTWERCRVKNPAFIGHPMGCVGAIVNEDDVIVSGCFTEKDLNHGVAETALEELSKRGLCPASKVVGAKKNQVCKLNVAPENVDYEDDKCVFYILNENDEAVSMCFTYDDLYKNGNYASALETMRRRGVCPAPLPNQFCEIESSAYDELHPNGCVNAVVNEAGTILSKCFSDSDVKNGVAGMALREKQRQGLCRVR